MKHIFKKALCPLLVLLILATGMISVGATDGDGTATLPETLYSEDFESYQSIASYETLGWSTYSNTDRLIFSLDTEASGNKRLKVGKAGWALTEFVSAEKMADARKYTISADVTVEELDNYFGIYFNLKENDSEKNCGVFQIRNETEGISFGHGVRKGGSWYQWDKGDNVFKLASEYNFALNTKLNVKIDVDLDANTSKLYCNDQLVFTVTDLASDSSTEGAIRFMFQNAVVYIDNISVVCTEKATGDNGGNGDGNVDNGDVTPPANDPKPAEPEKTEPETEPETDAPETTAAPESEAETEAADEGCGSVVAGGIGLLSIAAVGGALVLKKKDD